MRDAHAPCRRRRSASKYSGAPRSPLPPRSPSSISRPFQRTPTRWASSRSRSIRCAAPIVALSCLSSSLTTRGRVRLTPSIRLTADHWLLVARRHWGVETSHQILDNAFEEDDHPWIEACPRAALVVAILRRIAYTMLALFRSVTQRSDERRATPWETLMTDPPELG